MSKVGSRACSRVDRWEITLIRGFVGWLVVIGTRGARHRKLLSDLMLLMSGLCQFNVPAQIGLAAGENPKRTRLQETEEINVESSKMNRRARERRRSSELSPGGKGGLIRYKVSAGWGTVQLPAKVLEEFENFARSATRWKIFGIRTCAMNHPRDSYDSEISNRKSKQTQKSILSTSNARTYIEEY